LACPHQRSKYLQRDPTVPVAELSSLRFAQPEPLAAAGDDVCEDLLKGRRGRHLGATAGRNYYV
jgi:hypothetical protein